MKLVPSAIAKVLGTFKDGADSLVGGIREIDTEAATLKRERAELVARPLCVEDHAALLVEPAIAHAEARIDHALATYAKSQREHKAGGSLPGNWLETLPAPVNLLAIDSYPSSSSPVPPMFRGGVAVAFNEHVLVLALADNLRALARRMVEEHHPECRDGVRASERKARLAQIDARLAELAKERARLVEALDEARAAIGSVRA